MFSFILFRVMGWKIVGELPSQPKKYIVIVAPHTSNWDFLIGVLVRGIAEVKVKFLGKKALFRAPYGWVFRVLGGYPVDRTKKTKLVDQVVDIFNSKEEFRITITPEGTRKKVKEWKSGFYYIALMAKVPIIRSVFDWGKKEVRFVPPFFPTGNYEKDIVEIKSVYLGVRGKQGELFDP